MVLARQLACLASPAGELSKETKSFEVDRTSLAFTMATNVTNCPGRLAGAGTEGPAVGSDCCLASVAGSPAFLAKGPLIGVPVSSPVKAADSATCSLVVTLSGPSSVAVASVDFAAPSSTVTAELAASTAA